MNPENFHLPDFLIADMYKHSLVILPDAQPVLKKAKEEFDQLIQKKEWYLGTNKKYITLVVNEKEAVYLKDESLQFLSAILGACKLNLGDVAIVNYEKDPLSYAALKEKLSPQFLLLFDVSAKQLHLPFTIPFYQVQQYDNCQLLLAPSMETMLGNTQDAKLEKSRLWLSLKKMFSIS